MRLTVRFPAKWRAHIYSRKVRDWLREFNRAPVLLPSDPGSGSERVSLSLLEEDLRRAAASCCASPSETIRRLAAYHLQGSRHDAREAPAKMENDAGTLRAAKSVAPASTGRVIWRGRDLTHLCGSRNGSAEAALVSAGMASEEARKLIYGA